MDLFQNKICLVSAKWWASFKQYVASKYKIRFEADSIRQAKKSWTGHRLLRGIRRNFSECDMSIDLPAAYIDDGEPERSCYDFGKQPQCTKRIDNNDLAGIFEGELRGGLVEQSDYIIVTPRMYDKLYLLYGGGPRYERKIVRGCPELYPFFLREFTY